ncbi:hypothetical protein [Flavobacterium gyeonganense]|uniref:hypothetical protein n=1 Tax=Flavobacterium gyeonganense TaxID=1310418 RepID=UPI002413E05D|nr:hypothetical protein [Flavobacterium gyeonganense]
MSINLAPVSSNFLVDLKTKTANSHKKLECLPVSASIISSDMKLSDYIHYLCLMHDVHKEIESVVFPLLSDIIDDIELRKKHTLSKMIYFILIVIKLLQPEFLMLKK